MMTAGVTTTLTVSTVPAVTSVSVTLTDTPATTASPAQVSKINCVMHHFVMFNVVVLFNSPTVSDHAISTISWTHNEGSLR